jgi:hypothetical protein
MSLVCKFAMRLNFLRGLECFCRIWARFLRLETKSSREGVHVRSHLGPRGRNLSRSYRLTHDKNFRSSCTKSITIHQCETFDCEQDAVLFPSS